MEERFHGNLDPRAEEFRPSMLNPNQLNLHLHHHHQQQQMSMYPPSVYYPSYSHPPLVPHQYSLPPPQGPAFYSAPPPQPIPPVVSTPSRTLLLSSVPVNSSESLVLMELQAFGEVRALEMERVYQGIVTVHFYDLRHAQRALTEIRQQHMHHQNRFPNHPPFYINSNHNNAVASPPAALLTYPATGASYSVYSSNSPPVRGLIAGCAVWAQYVVPMSACFPDGNNQGTVVLFNLDSSVTTNTLKQIFESFGPVKELRETPMKRRQKFVEFYDIRDAAKAFEEMNGKEIHGRNVVIEFSRPGGYGRRLYNSSSSYNCSDYQTRPPPPSKPLHHHHSAEVSDNQSDDGPQTCFNNPGQQRTTKKPNSSLERTDAENKDGSEVAGDVLENSMASLGIIETRSSGSSIEERNNNNNNGGGRRMFGKIGNGNYGSSSRGRSNKLGKQKNLDSRFLIKQDAILESSDVKDSRTTIMIKNIPNKYSQKLLLNMLDNHCIHCNEQIIATGDGDHHHQLPLSSYDFVYLPIDFNNKCNVGYGFVNMTSPEATLRLYKAFHLQSWEVFNSRKICEVTYARVQGLEALKEHFKNSKFPSVADEIFPVVFAPPRDGKTQTEPLPIYGITPKTTTNGGSNNFMMTVTATSKAADDEDHHHRHNHHHGSGAGGGKPSLVGLEASSNTSHTTTTEADELEGDDWIDNDDDDDDTEDRLGFGNYDENNRCSSSDA